MFQSLAALDWSKIHISNSNETTQVIFMDELVEHREMVADEKSNTTVKIVSGFYSVKIQYFTAILVEILNKANKYFSKKKLMAYYHLLRSKESLGLKVRFISSINLNIFPSVCQRE